MTFSIPTPTKSTDYVGHLMQCLKCSMDKDCSDFPLVQGTRLGFTEKYRKKICRRCYKTLEAKKKYKEKARRAKLSKPGSWVCDNCNGANLSNNCTTCGMPKPE